MLASLLRPRFFLSTLAAVSLAIGGLAVMPAPTAGAAAPLLVPQPVWVDLATNHFDRVLAVSDQGEVYNWGNYPGAWGGLGPAYDGYNILRTPQRLTELDTLGLGYANRVVHVAAGTWHALALTADNRVVAWGQNSKGQLGMGGTNEVPKPTYIPSFPPAGQTVKKLYALDYLSFALMDSGELYTWGYNNWSVYSPLGYDTATPTLVTAGGLPLLEELSLSPHLTLALSKSGELWNWGPAALQPNPSNTDLPRQVTTLGVTLEHVMTSHHYVPYGITAAGDVINLRTPTAAPIMTGFGGGQLAVGADSEYASSSHNVLGLDSAGNVWARGFNNYGQLGLGHLTTPVNTAQRVTAFDGLLGPTETVVAIYASNLASFARTDAGRVFAWGAGYWPKLDTHEWGNRSTPGLVQVFIDPLRPINPVPSMIGTSAVGELLKVQIKGLPAGTDVSGKGCCNGWYVEYAWVLWDNGELLGTSSSLRVPAKALGRQLVLVLYIFGPDYLQMFRWNGGLMKPGIPVKVTGVKVSPTKATLAVGKTKKLVATVSPTNATNKKVTWASSNTKVATVSASGVVTAKAAGKATITVRTADGGKKANCVVTVSKPAPPKPTPVKGMVQFVLSSSLTGAKYGDVLAVDQSGGLWRAAGSASGKLGARVKLGSGWGKMTVYAPGDWNRDGKADLVGVDTGGRMWLYPGNGKGGLGKAKQIGHGWTKYTVIPAGDLNGDKINDMLAINNQTGVLLLYLGDGKGGFKPGYRQVGHGWKDMQLFPAGDLNKDGKTDVLGLKADGRLFFYAGKGDGSFKPAVQVGHGWKNLTLVAGADINGDKIADIVSYAPSGVLNLYKGKGGGSFYPPVQIATGY